MKNIFKEDDIIYRYTCKDAEKDGFLFDITKVTPKWKKGIFNYITSNLLSRGYSENGKISVPNLIDLLNQALRIVKKKSKNFKKFDYFFSGKLELPNGEKQKIYIVQNETGKFTIMLPEDY